MTNSPAAGNGKAGQGNSPHHVRKSGKSGDGELSKLLVADTPAAGESLTAAAGASGVNGPLAVFVAVIALLMGVLAYRRHLRSRVR